MMTFVARRLEDLNKKSQGSAENQHQTRLKKRVFEKEKEAEKIQKDKSKKQARQETPRIEEVDESEDEVEAVASTISKRQKLPYVEVCKGNSVYYVSSSSSLPAFLESIGLLSSL